MSLLALYKEHSWLRLISWCSSTGLLLNTRITLFPEASPFPRYMSLKQTELFQLPLWEFCGVPDYTGLSQEIVLSSSFRPWLTKCSSHVAEDQSCWSIRPACDLPLPLLPAQEPFPNFRKAFLWAVELFSVLDMTVVKVLFVLINMEGLVNIFLPPLWLENLKAKLQL